MKTYSLNVGIDELNAHQQRQADLVVRLDYPRFCKINPGDRISLRSNGKLHPLKRRVVAVRVYDHLANLAKSEKLRRIHPGMDLDNLREKIRYWRRTYLGTPKLLVFELADL